jgi:plastocyanin
MKRIIIALVIAAAAAPAFAAELTGKVTLTGTPPPEVEITPLKNDPNCGKLVTETPKTIHYVVGPNGELANTVVIVKGVPDAKSTGPSAPPAVIDQKSCLYVPHILAVQTGQKILVKNSDPVLHNVNTTRPNAVEGNPQQNMAQLAGAPDLTFTFPKPEPFLRFKCDVHPWMFAYVYVVDHPYFAVTGADGTFKIPNLPPGKYTVEAHHRKGGTVTKEVEITEAGGKIEFTIAAK